MSEEVKLKLIVVEQPKVGESVEISVRLVDIKDKRDSFCLVVSAGCLINKLKIALAKKLKISEADISLYTVKEVKENFWINPRHYFNYPIISPTIYYCGLYYIRYHVL